VGEHGKKATPRIDQGGSDICRGKEDDQEEEHEVVRGCDATEAASVILPQGRRWCAAHPRFGPGQKEHEAAENEEDVYPEKPGAQCLEPVDTKGGRGDDAVIDRDLQRREPPDAVEGREPLPRRQGGVVQVIERRDTIVGASRNTRQAQSRARHDGGMRWCGGCGRQSFPHLDLMRGAVRPLSRIVLYASRDTACDFGDPNFREGVGRRVPGGQIHSVATHGETL